MNLLISHGTVLVPQWPVERRASVRWQTLPDHHVLICDEQIEAVSPDIPASWQPDEILDATGCVVLPGLINTHHHLFQSLSRCLPAVQNASLFAWLTDLDPSWREVDYAVLKLAVQCRSHSCCCRGTTANDIMYLSPR